MIKIFTDGGARGNPGSAAIGVHITNEKNKVLGEVSKPIGIATNNVAEYKAVIAGFAWLLGHKNEVKKHKTIHFFMDSLLVCSQLRGVYKVKHAVLRDLLLGIRMLEAELGLPVSYFHISREKNSLADRLVNIALDNNADSL